MVCLALFSCMDSTIHIDHKSEIVIDGWIEQGKIARVLLSLSAPYYDTIDSISLRDYIISQAKVTLSDGVDEEVLTMKPYDSGFPGIVYESSKIRGEVGKNYLLTVDYRGKQVSAMTSIPDPVELDFIRFEFKDGSDSLGFIRIGFNDPLIINQQYLTFTKIIGEEEEFKPTMFPVFDDEYLNGKKIEVSLLKGNVFYSWLNDSAYFHKGDSVMVKFCSITDETYKFWVSLLRESKNNGNPFSSTNSKIETNVDNGLGVWSGYGAKYYLITTK